MNSPKKIIVVEEDVIIGDVLAIKLKKLEYVVDKARDGVVAMQKIRATKPDCIVLDILLSSKAGIQLFQDLKADAALKNIPILLTATAEDRDEVKHARELGARDFLIKAVIDPNEVIEKVKQLLSAGAAAPSAPSTPVTAAPAPAATTSAPTPAASGKTFVLVIEDDKFLRELLVRKLGSEGFDVENAIDATAAYAALEKRKPTIILCDLILPEVSGFEILAKIKADPKTKDIPVIILSNLGQKEDTDKAMALGAKDFMVKANFTLDEIVEKIRATLA
jgi:DNA-binding response OmpR family regulator